MITHEIKVDMVPGKPQPKICLSKGDTDFEILCTLYAGTGTLSVENGTTASLNGRKADGTTYTVASLELDEDNGEYVATIPGTEDMTSVAGLGACEICLTSDDKELHSQNIRVFVEDI